jgi:hypothetical protein
MLSKSNFSNIYSDAPEMSASEVLSSIVFFKQVLQRHPKRIRNLHQRSHRRIPATPLYIRQIATLNRSPFREMLLWHNCAQRSLAL